MNEEEKKEKRRGYALKHYYANQEEYNKYNRQYRKDNHESLMEYQRRYRKELKEGKRVKRHIKRRPSKKTMNVCKDIVGKA